MKTLRRFYLDQCLKQYSTILSGNIIDIGGTSINKRGSFAPPVSQVSLWHYSNISSKSLPDFQIDIDLPLPNSFPVFGFYHGIICTEVIEYLQNITVFFDNIRSLSKPGAYILLSSPWMNTYHGDKAYDFLRYSESYLKTIFTRYDLTIVSQTRCGGLFSVIWDLIHRITYDNSSNKVAYFLLRVFLKLSRHLCLKLDRVLNTSSIVHTGYFYVLRVPN